jgi:hypothetical protein
MLQPKIVCSARNDNIQKPICAIGFTKSTWLIIGYLRMLCVEVVLNIGLHTSSNNIQQPNRKHSIRFHFILIPGNSNTGQRPSNMEHVSDIRIKLGSVKRTERVKTGESKLLVTNVEPSHSILNRSHTVLFMQLVHGQTYWNFGTTQLTLRQTQSII